MFFKKHSKPKEKLSAQQIMDMRQEGKSDKEILKKFRKDGYSYDDIERAMLQSVKSGVEESEEMPSPQQPASQQPAPQPPAPQMEQQDYNLPEAGKLFNEQQPAPKESFDAETVIEELVESIVEEKTGHLSKRMEKLEGSLKEVKSLLKKRPSAEQSKQHPDWSKIEDTQKRLDELDARISGVEKAFKQFLPSLTKNVENLSNMIHELKKKTSQVGES